MTMRMLLNMTKLLILMDLSRIRVSLFHGLPPCQVEIPKSTLRPEAMWGLVGQKQQQFDG